MKAKVTPTSRQVRVQPDSYEKLEEIATKERRPITDQVALIVDEYHAKWKKRK